MKPSQEKKVWSFVGIFIISLMVSLPFYSADALATSLQITKNSGEGGVEGFIDAEGDVWTVEALISDLNNETVSPQDVKIKIGANEATFQSCSDSALGTLCKYVSVLADGVSEMNKVFQVVYEMRDQFGNVVINPPSDTSYIKTDSEAPTITWNSISQTRDGKVKLDFTVTEETTTFVGIKSIKIIDVESGELLQLIDNFEMGVGEFNYLNDGGTSGILPVSLEGEGTRRIKIEAEDWFGHQRSKNSRPVSTDFVAPSIRSESLNFTQIGKFIGSKVTSSDMTIDIFENIGLDSSNVKAYSDQARLNDQSASFCTSLDELEEGLIRCQWNDVQLNPESVIEITFTITDDFGNTIEETISKSLSKDTSAPEVDFFGTERVYQDESYISDGEKRIILEVSESGSGFSEVNNWEGIRANFNSLGVESNLAPDNCTQTESTFNCYWDIDAQVSSDGEADITLSTFKDSVGNEGQGGEVTIIKDISAPKVESIEFYGNSEVGDKDYFQSNDEIKIKMKIKESSAPIILLNLNGVVMDAENIYEEDVYTRGLGKGWKAYDYDYCDQVNVSEWECEFTTDPIQSGHIRTATLEMKVQDVAGNDASFWPSSVKNMNIKDDGKYTFEILSLKDEPNPDYWEVKGLPKFVPSYVDLDTTELIPSRISVDFNLGINENNQYVEAVGVDLVNCQLYEDGETSNIGPEIQDSILYGGVSPEGDDSPNLKLLLIFEPFDGKDLFGIGSDKSVDFDEATATYSCDLRVYSKYGNEAIRNAETQEVIFDVPFAFSSLGAMDENLDEKIKSIQEEALFKIADKLQILNEILTYLRYFANLVSIVNNVMNIINVFKGSTEPIRGLPIVGAGIAIGFCESAQGTQIAKESWLEWIQLPMAILTCSPNPKLGWYAEYQQGVLNVYNVMSGRGLIGLGANSLYENVYTSMIGLCLPGIVYNLEQYRQVRCREMLCYQREVPQGVASVDSCRKLGSYLECRYWLGPALQFTPLNVIDQVFQIIKSLFTSPMGWIKVGLQLPCLVACTVSNISSEVCTVSAVLINIGNIAENIVGAVYGWPGKVSDPYCSQIKDQSDDKENTIKSSAETNEGV